MRLIITGRHIEITAALRRYIETRIKHVDRYGVNLGKIQVSLGVEKFRHTAEAVCGCNGKMLQAKTSTAEMYSAIDGVMDKLESQVRKLKERLVDHKPRAGQRASLSRSRRSSLNLPKVSVVRPLLRSLTIQEAIAHLAEQPSAILVFENASSGKMHVMQRLDDGAIQLIDPETGDVGRTHAGS